MVLYVLCPDAGLAVGGLLGREDGPHGGQDAFSAGGHGADDPIFHGINTDGIVIHADRRALGRFFVEGCDDGFYFGYFRIQQILDEIGLVDAQVGCGSHGRSFFVEKPVTGSLVDAPAFRSSVAEGGPEGDHTADDAFADQLPGPLVGFGEALVLVDHQYPAGPDIPGYAGSV